MFGLLWCPYLRRKKVDLPCHFGVGVKKCNKSVIIPKPEQTQFHHSHKKSADLCLSALCKCGIFFGRNFTSQIGFQWIVFWFCLCIYLSENSRKRSIDMCFFFAFNIKDHDRTTQFYSHIFPFQFISINFCFFQLKSNSNTINIE